MRTLRARSGAALVAAAALALVVGCSSQPTVDTDVQESTPSPTVEEVVAEESTTPTPEPSPEPEPEPEIAIGEIGFIANEYGGAMAYAVVENPSSHVADVWLSVTAFDANGAVLATTSASPPLLRSGQSAPAISDLFVDEGVTIDHITAVIDTADTQVDNSPTSVMTGTNLSWFSDSWGSSRLTGIVDSAYVNSYDQVLVAALCRDGAGTVTGAGYGYTPSFVTPGANTPFEISVTGTGSADTCTVDASPTNISSERQN